MSAVYGLFDILALLYVLRSIQLGFTIWRDWPAIYAEPLTARKKALAEQAAFFIAVPLSVFIHEAAHAVAVWLAGGEVVEFGYRVFWGYVVPRGSFTPVQMWAIAVAGTLGSLLFGLAVWQVTRRSASSSVRYFGLRAFRFQVFFSLVYYPIFTLVGFDGDWRTIYNFAATPLLSGLTAVAHLATLFLFWRGDRQGWFEAASQETAAEQARFARLQADALAAPGDTAAQLRYVDALRRGGADRTAQRLLTAVIRSNPQDGLAYLELAALQSGGKSQVPRAAHDSAARALALGLDAPEQRAYARELTGRYFFADGALEEALAEFNAALAALAEGAAGPAGAGTAQTIQLLLLRNQTCRRLHRYAEAHADLQQAQILAQLSGNTAALQQVQQELAVLNKHAGQEYYLPAAAQELKP